MYIHLTLSVSDTLPFSAHSTNALDLSCVFNTVNLRKCRGCIVLYYCATL